MYKYSLKEYIDRGSLIIVTERLEKEILKIAPKANVISRPIDGICNEVVVVDRFIKDLSWVRNITTRSTAIINMQFTNRSIEILKHDLGILSNISTVESKEANLLEIILKNADSVPDVWYKGKKLDNKTNINYSWETQSATYLGEQNIEIKYFEKTGKYHEIKTIGRERLS